MRQFINASPHVIRLGHRDEATGEVIVDMELPSDPEATKALTAKPTEKLVEKLDDNVEFVATKFEGSAAGEEYLRGLEAGTLVLGSVITMNAFPGVHGDGVRVVGMLPVPGLERVPPAEKVMRWDRFNVALS
jgi:hypothetical protein